jgi:predicted CopG family antitoxin
MQKKLTITVDERVYRALYKTVGRRRISRFIENLVRPHVLYPSLAAGYEKMAQDEQREKDALDWAEGLIGDVIDEPR